MVKSRASLEPQRPVSEKWWLKLFEKASERYSTAPLIRGFIAVKWVFFAPFRGLAELRFGAYRGFSDGFRSGNSISSQRKLRLVH
jgi:hypothetical protein